MRHAKGQASIQACIMRKQLTIHIMIDHPHHDPRHLQAMHTMLHVHACVLHVHACACACCMCMCMCMHVYVACACACACMCVACACGVFPTAWWVKAVKSVCKTNEPSLRAKTSTADATRDITHDYKKTKVKQVRVPCSHELPNLAMASQNTLNACCL